MRSLKNLFNQPYPFYYRSWKNIFIQGCAFAIATTAFLYFFQPFTVYFPEHRLSFWGISVVNGCVVGLAFIVFTAFLKTFAPRFFTGRGWSVGKEIGFWFSLLLLIGIAMFFRRELIYDNPYNFTLRFFIEEVVNTFLVGSLIVGAAVMLNYIHLLRTTSQKAQSWNELVRDYRQRQSDNPSVTVTAAATQDEISFRLSEFVYALVDGNYVEFYLEDAEGTIRRHIKRNTLSHVEEQLKHYPGLLRIHRSCLVNLRKIDSVSGNAQGYKITLSGTDTSVPVSRSYIPAFDAAMKQ